MNSFREAQEQIDLYHASTKEVMNINKQEPDLQIPLNQEERLQYYYSFLVEGYKKQSEAEFEESKKIYQKEHARVLSKAVTRKAMIKYIENIIQNKRYFSALTQAVKTKDVKKVAQFLNSKKTFALLAEGLFLEDED